MSLFSASEEGSNPDIEYKRKGGWSMKWFNNLKIGTKLIGGFGLIAMIAGVIGFTGITNIMKINKNDTELYERMTIPISQMGEISNAFERVRVDLAKVLIVSGIQEKEKYEAHIQELSATISRVNGEFEKTLVGQEEKDLFKAFVDSRAVFRPIISRIIQLSKAGKNGEAAALYNNEAVTAARVEQAAIEKLIAAKVADAKETSGKNAAMGRSAVTISIALTILGFILAIVTGSFIARNISRPLRENVLFAEAVASGDLTHSLREDRNDEIGALARALNAMSEALRGVINKMVDTSNTVSAAANQLSGASLQMATGAEEVAAQTATVAVASEQMSATATEIARNCCRAAESSKQANDTALHGEGVVEETISVMSRISLRVNESSRTVETLGSRSEQIGEIIGTIEDIADQTNLLALNAAIEAARAGEQGRGFAVVADEVRALAERTTRATREIGSMIKAIQDETRGAVSSMVEGVREVETGTSEAAKSGDSLKEILNQINSVAMEVSQIAAAAEEQTATISEISGNISQITEVVQETARGAQESADAARQLAGMAEELQSLAGHFKLEAA
jgi:methyl-accepting chemotaxis protein